MANIEPTRTRSAPSDDDGLSKDVKELIQTLPKERGWRTRHLYYYQGFWTQPKEIQSIISTQKHFKASDSDLFILSIPKSGTTWLKALMFAIVNRHRYSLSDHPLLTANPHDLVPFLEYKLYANNRTPPDLSTVPPPRLFASHIPYPSLPESIRTSKCKTVYICRNPVDNFISLWHFVSKVRPEHLEPFSIDEALDMFCKGKFSLGPFWDHVLGYWNQSLENPEKVLFFKYEEMREDTIPHVKRLAEFLGYPFTAAEEKQGLVEGISRLCSFETLKELEPNKTGRSIAYYENRSLFRKGQVGDWKNHLTPEMGERLNEAVAEKLQGTGLSFKCLVPDS